MGRRDVVALVVAAAALVGVAGCGFVEDDPAGSAAPNEREVAIPTVTTVPTPTLPDDAPNPAGADQPSDPSDPVPSPGPQQDTTVPTLSEADRRAIARCEAIRRFQDAGIDVMVVSIKRSPELVPAMRRFQTVADELLTELEPQVRSQVEPAVSSVRVAVPGVELRSPQQLIDEWNGVLVSSVPLWQQAIRALAATCPSVIPAETVDQVAVFRLGMDLPDGVDPEFAFI